MITKKADDTTSDLGTVFEHFKELALIAGETKLSTEDIIQSITHTQNRFMRGIFNEIVPAVVKHILSINNTERIALISDMDDEISMMTDTQRSFELVNVESLEKDVVIAQLRKELSAFSNSANT